ncbi:MAG TPA: glucuronate isomerase [Cyclobacteriaceae bacterium]|nr:MAG: D-glucuronate isomerase [Bacteroidetes bacterium OLB12]HNR74610.1 glucuronate isomerase [Cyclobacteriaceae bacterium]HNT50058.1 glucuronate isomerase [Cyclobacteriaceae bacterium]
MSFITENFLLQSTFAQKLYHEYVSTLPIIDYHNHLPPAEIAADRKFENLTQIWLGGDHYKWRAMRTLGIDESFITGRKSDREKFLKWAEAVPYTMRNPLYHWTHLELQRYFQISDLLQPNTAALVYDRANEALTASEFSTRMLLTKMHVEVVCTTDDPVDSLQSHQQVAKTDYKTKVLPTFRPDKVYNFTSTADFLAYKDLLTQSSGVEITSYDTLLVALQKRIDFFHQQGCRLADHGLGQIPFLETDSHNPSKLFEKLNRNEALSLVEVQAFRFYVLVELCRLYHQRGWVQQFHLGALRNTNKRMLSQLGPDTGFDSIGDFSQASALASFLNVLDSTNQLCKTILYNLNPADNEVFAAMIGNFNDGSVKGKIQYGSAWWFLDQKDGMEKQINALSNMGLLSCFIGMLTDSRSFMSFPRHEYFRRILCNLIGEDVVKGELPNDEKWLGKLVADVCYYNAKEYFNF